MLRPAPCAKWPGIAKPPGSPSRGDGGLGVARGCYSEGRGEAELAGGQANCSVALLVMGSIVDVPVCTVQATWMWPQAGRSPGCPHGWGRLGGDFERSEKALCFWLFHRFSAFQSFSKLLKLLELLDPLEAPGRLTLRCLKDSFSRLKDSVFRLKDSFSR